MVSAKPPQDQTNCIKETMDKIFYLILFQESFKGNTLSKGKRKQNGKKWERKCDLSVQSHFMVSTFLHIHLVKITTNKLVTVELDLTNMAADFFFFLVFHTTI